MNISPQVEEHTVSVDNRRVFYTARGPEDAPVIYMGLNGLMGGGDSFWPVIEGVPSDWRVILPDLPGCGRSETMPSPHVHDTTGYSQWLERFVAALGIEGKPIVLATVATAAPIALHHAWEHRDKVRGLVLHLPFLGKVGIGNKWLRPLVAYSLLMPPLRALAGSLRSSDYLMHKLILHEPPDAIPEMAERDIDHKQQGDLVAAGELLHDLMLTDARAELRHLTIPVLMLASEHDFSAPVPMLEELLEGHPERKLYVYRGGVHSWNEEFIDAMNREIAEFTARLEAESPAGKASGH